MSSHKFDSELAEQLYVLAVGSMHNFDLGSVEDIGWHGLFLSAPDDDDLPPAILYENDQGFVSCDVFETDDAALTHWRLIEAAYDRWYGEDS